MLTSTSVLEGPGPRFSHHEGIPSASGLVVRKVSLTQELCGVKVVVRGPIKVLDQVVVAVATVGVEVEVEVWVAVG
jgi:hypothetical protein